MGVIPLGYLACVPLLGWGGGVIGQSEREEKSL